MKWIFKTIDNIVVDEQSYSFTATMPRIGEIWYDKNGKSYLIKKISWHISGDLSERIVIFDVIEL